LYLSLPLSKASLAKNFRAIFRFAKLLLRLPALRSIGLKCAEHTFFFKLIKEDRPYFAGADLRDLDGETGDYDQRNPLDNFMHGILDE
jgi:hypothetical protein